jgi:glycine betaine/choline ABC-type transport system substrate-binding protein
MVIGSDSEFANRTDGYPGLLEAYPGLGSKSLSPWTRG